MCQGYVMFATNACICRRHVHIFDDLILLPQSDCLSVSLSLWQVIRRVKHMLGYSEAAAHLVQPPSVLHK